MTEKPQTLFLSVKGETHPLVQRMNRRGVPTAIYIHDLAHRSAFANVHPRLGLDDLLGALKTVDTVVIDTIARNKKTPRDLALLDKFGISHNVQDLYGVLGDKLKRPPYSIPHVIGGGEMAADYELNREKGVELAKLAGLSIPPYEEFSSIKQGIKFLEGPGKGKRWVLKPSGNIDLDLTFPETFEGELLDILKYSLPKRVGGDALEFILQQFVLNADGSKGVECSNEVWSTGKEGKLLHPNRTIEDKKLYSRKCGPAVGSQVNLVWLCKNLDGIVFKGVQKLIPLLQKMDYWGALDFNVIITSDGQAWYLEPTFRFGYSALYLLLSLILPDSLPNFFINPFNAIFRKGGFVASQVVTLDPFPSQNREELNKKIVGNLINHPVDLQDMWWLDVLVDDEGKLRCAGADGLVGVMACYDRDREEAIRKVYRKIEKLQITGNLQYWPLQEHLESHLGRLNMLRRWGVQVF
jgi:hypothetical protein